MHDVREPYAAAVPKGPSQHETAIYNAVAALLNARITPHDDGSAPGMYDATIEYGGGRRAALEVTRVIDSNELKLESISERTIPLGGVDDWLDIRLVDSALTLAEILGAIGYRTAAFVGNFSPASTYSVMRLLRSLRPGLSPERRGWVQLLQEQPRGARDASLLLR